MTTLITLETSAVLLSAATTAASAFAASEFIKRIILGRRLKGRLVLLGEAKTQIELGLAAREHVAKRDGSPNIPALERPRTGHAMRQVLVRLDEAREMQRRQYSLATVSIWSARLLTFGQYVIGGVLASSFVQQKTSPEVIGVFGVLVLLASLITQHYHPELSAQVASQKAELLGVLIRESEDRIVVIETTCDPEKDLPIPILDLLERISAELKVISAISSSGALSR